MKELKPRDQAPFVYEYNSVREFKLIPAQLARCEAKYVEKFGAGKITLTGHEQVSGAIWRQVGYFEKI